MLLIFDCDGVLIDSERMLNSIFRDVLLDLGLTLSFEEVIERFKGRSTADCLKIAEQLLGSSLPVNEIEQRFEDESLSRFQEEIRPIPGITEALSELEALPKCVASSSSHDHIRLGLTVSGLGKFFSTHIFSASEVELGKPAPDLFLLAASKMGYAPSECIVIEDSPAGVAGGVSAGMRVLGFADLTSPNELEREGAVVFDSMRELPSLIEAMNER